MNSNSLQKAREAQAKFEENKKKIEQAIAKAEALKKKAKTARERALQLKATFKATKSIKGGIAAIIASQVGNMRATLVVQVQKNILNILNKFSDKCPTQAELERLLKTRNTLLSHTSSMKKRVGKLNKVAAGIEATIKTVKLTIKIITSIPVPTAIIPPQVGGLGIPISILTKYSNSLDKLNKTLDRLIEEAATIKVIIASIDKPLASIEDKLKLIDTAIQDCLAGKELQDVLQLVDTAQPKENTGTEGIPNEKYLYKGYILGIVQDPNSPKIAPKRYAIAKDKRGIIVLKGQSSFSSSTDVLLDEIKFRIDQLL